MVSLGFYVRPTVGVLLALGLGGFARGADPLAGTSPFLPPAGAAGNGAKAPDTPIELRGIVTDSGSTMFSIYDPAHHSASWAKVNEIGHDFIVRSYDPAKDTVTVDYAGSTITLTLHTAKVVSAPATAPPPQAGAASPSHPATQPVGGPVVLNPTPSDEQRRLEAIAAEVNRRRMLRQQALQAGRQTTPQFVRPGQPPVQQVPNQQR